METLANNLIGLVDYKNGGVYAHIYGPCDGIAIVFHIMECFGDGFHSIMSSIERVLGAWNWGWKGEVACVVLLTLLELGLVAFILRLSSWRLSLLRFSQYFGLGLPFVYFPRLDFIFSFQAYFSR